MGFYGGESPFLGKLLGPMPPGRHERECQPYEAQPQAGETAPESSPEIPLEGPPGRLIGVGFWCVFGGFAIHFGWSRSVGEVMLGNASMLLADDDWKDISARKVRG